MAEGVFRKDVTNFYVECEIIFNYVPQQARYDTKHPRYIPKHRPKAKKKHVVIWQ